jgi:hypothetical protein
VREKGEEEVGNIRGHRRSRWGSGERGGSGNRGRSHAGDLVGG